MEAIQSRVESWIRDQKAKIMKVSWGPLQWRMRWWPPWSSFEQREQRKRIQLEYERRRKQLHDLCRALQADSIPDLQDILCCMVLSECVYKRPATELVRAVNKFKADFGGHVVSIERVQPSADHVPHRYLLAEAGDTLFASFVGTKQYKDVMADANILQGAIFHDDMEDADESEATDSDRVDGQKGSIQNSSKSLETKIKQPRGRPKPAAHRGFLARAKGIPALELYRLAQKKKRKLVLCGHSLGGAVAALATLAILRVISASASLKENEKLPVKCITFSQPAVGNAALRDYVNTKGWHQYFKSYCIPEDLVPRILSPAYFHHYIAQIPSVPIGTEIAISNKSTVKGETAVEKKKDSDGEQLVLGLGPIQNSFWRLSRLVPLEGVRRQINNFRRKQVESIEESASHSIALEDEAMEPQSLEIQEGSDSISLKPISDGDNKPSDITLAGKSTEKSQKDGDGRRWHSVPYLPSYVPFGQLYLLGNSSVELLSGAEYSKLTSVRSVIAELRERFQSHSMKSYRSRFQRICELCMGDSPSIFPGLDQLQQFPNLQQWLGLAVIGTVELGHIVEAPVIRSATSIVPLGWNGTVEKNGEPFKVDIAGFGLHLCTLIHAQVNGTWCSTTVESFPSQPPYSNHDDQQELQKMRVLVGPPLKRPPYHQIVEDSLLPAFSTINKEPVKVSSIQNSNPSDEVKYVHPDDPIDLYIFCTSDFTTVSREVHLRTRIVRLIGLEGAGKTSLFKAIMGQGKIPVIANIESLFPDSDVQEGIAGGVCYSDSLGVNLQELSNEASRFRDELWAGIRDLSQKTDLIVLVHNLSHKIPQYNSPDGLEKKPALSLLLDEAKALGIPWVLAITNKFSVSAHQQKAAIEAVLQGYRASRSSTEVVNSCPYVIPSAATASLSWAPGSSEQKKGVQKLIFAPINIVRMPFQRKDTVFPVEGVNSLCQLVHRVLQSHEEASLEELARERLMLELARDREGAMDASRDLQAKSSVSAATVGASVGAGLGLALAVVMGAASALRKP
ncbi:uncharacterized protein LOC116213599 isoform X2 [Punica granatum]|uniref:Uncharacterized protein LOC116213599 isoform X2 n=2 Tax=Punica granatum TaxID=22663 RepID=A0A6P8ED67_PUNGR|nr:uncharacterized protein LOC116213599 isoform X2 [Punica granatum]